MTEQILIDKVILDFCKHHNWPVLKTKNSYANTINILVLVQDLDW